MSVWAEIWERVLGFRYVYILGECRHCECEVCARVRVVSYSDESLKGTRRLRLSVLVVSLDLGVASPILIAER